MGPPKRQRQNQLPKPNLYNHGGQKPQEHGHLHNPDMKQRVKTGGVQERGIQEREKQEREKQEKEKRERGGSKMAHPSRMVHGRLADPMLQESYSLEGPASTAPTRPSVPRDIIRRLANLPEPSPPAREKAPSKLASLYEEDARGMNHSAIEGAKGETGPSLQASSDTERVPDPWDVQDGPEVSKELAEHAPTAPAPAPAHGASESVPDPAMAAEEMAEGDESKERSRKASGEARLEKLWELEMENAALKERLRVLEHGCAEVSPSVGTLLPGMSTDVLFP